MQDVQHDGHLYRERDGLSRLRLLDVPAVTPGMVTVGRDDEDWRRRPELRWQVWPDLLERID
jgi:hypothetical protein